MIFESPDSYAKLTIEAWGAIQANEWARMVDRLWPNLRRDSQASRTPGAAT